MKYSIYILFAFFASLLFSCEAETDESRLSNLPTARGGNGDIIVVMDSAHWAGEIGAEIRETFRAPIPGLPQDEPHFFLNYVNPYQMNDVLRNVKNLIYVATMDNQSSAGRRLKSEFTRESIEKIAQDPNLFMLPKKNVFAKDQEVLHLFGNNSEELVKNIQNNREKLREHFHKAELSRIKKSLFANEMKTINNMLQQEHQFSLRIPANYDLVFNKNNFVWIRQLDTDVDKNIFISYQDYATDEIFKDENILKLRNLEIKKLGTDTDDVVYMTTETLIPIETEQISFGNKYAVETRGLWKLTNNTMGGPFLSYIFVDEELNRLYYIEGYVYSPGKDKRNSMKELEAILTTFKTQSELQPS